MLLDRKFGKMQCKIRENLKMIVAPYYSLAVTKSTSIPITAVH
jgi:hypothetical protein